MLNWWAAYFIVIDIDSCGKGIRRIASSPSRFQNNKKDRGMRVLYNSTLYNSVHVFANFLSEKRMILLSPVDKYNIIKTKRSSLSARVCVPTTGHITRLLLSSLKCQTSPAVSLLVSLLLFSRVCSSARIYTPTPLTRSQKFSFCEIYCYNDIITMKEILFIIPAETNITNILRYQKYFGYYISLLFSQR